MSSKYALVSLDELLRHLASDHYMGKAEAQAYSGLSAKTLVAAPDLPHYQPNGKTLWRKSEIDAWMRRHCKDSEPIDFDSRMSELQKEFRKVSTNECTKPKKSISGK